MKKVTKGGDTDPNDKKNEESSHDGLKEKYVSKLKTIKERIVYWEGRYEKYVHLLYHN